MANAVLSWLKGHVPTRESLAQNRWTKPFARQLLRPDLWRFNRRSVPRAVALGLLVGPIIPVAHTVPAVLLAVPFRGNIVIAGVTTWVISNPITYLPLYAAAGAIGRALMNTDVERAKAAIALAWQQGWGSTFSCLLSEGQPYALGVVVLSVILAVVGYLASSIFWRFYVGQKWRRRLKRMSA